MAWMRFERVCRMSAAQLRLGVLANAGVAALAVCAAPLLWGVQFLDTAETAAVLERHVALTGIILFTPVFLPEQKHAVREVVDAKAASAAAAPLLRLFMQGFVLAILSGGAIWLLRAGGCVFPALPFWFGTFATAAALGSVGAFAACVSDSVVAGYLAALAYYFYSLFGGRLGPLSLFGMADGWIPDKGTLLAGSLLLFMSAVFWRVRSRTFSFPLITR